jgi:hypothetical protein
MRGAFVSEQQDVPLHHSPWHPVKLESFFKNFDVIMHLN